MRQAEYLERHADDRQLISERRYQIAEPQSAELGILPQWPDVDEETLFHRRLPRGENDALSVGRAVLINPSAT
jgi:hypothetical protein